MQARHGRFEARTQARIPVCASDVREDVRREEGVSGDIDVIACAADNVIDDPFGRVVEVDANLAVDDVSADTRMTSRDRHIGKPVDKPASACRSDRTSFHLSHQWSWERAGERDV